MAKFTSDQLDQYMELTDRASAAWIRHFPEKAAYSPEYWHLFCGMFKKRHEEITKGEALEFLNAARIKSPVTKAKVIEAAKRLGYIVERRSEKDKRSVILSMTPRLRNNMEAYLGETLALLTDGLRHLQRNGKRGS